MLLLLPSYLIKWIQILLHNISSKIIINNIQSPSINVKCGIRQGCPLSMLIFIIGTEPLPQKILANPQIKDLSLGTTKLIINHYAGDLTIFVTDPQSFSPISKTLKMFSFYSGLKVNPSKTELVSNSSNISSSFSAAFPDGKVTSSSKILGINFSFDPQKLTENWTKILHSLERKIASLNPRDSLFSKILSVNSHVIPQILFQARVTAPTPLFIKTINKALFKFLWNYSTYEPIKRSKLYLPKHKGGIPKHKGGPLLLNNYL